MGLTPFQWPFNKIDITPFTTKPFSRPAQAVQVCRQIVTYKAVHKMRFIYIHDCISLIGTTLQQVRIISTSWLQVVKKSRFQSC